MPLATSFNDVFYQNRVDLPEDFKKIPPLFVYTTIESKGLLSQITFFDRKVRYRFYRVNHFIK
jgi:hypothetical protein